MLRFGLAILLFIFSGCTSSDININTASAIADRTEMIFVPPVEVYEISFQGFTGQETTDCIQMKQVRSIRVIDRIGIIYEMPDRKIWFNRPEWGASTLKEYLVIVTQGNQNMLCSGDIVRLKDNSPDGIVGTVGLGPFVRYPDSQ
ncbi:hypothetical protein AB1K62_00025 [Parasphingorhabdus sp. JC815]|uniref:hypothetical protein n=1 Tax=Parasphingorhabdus sp. JC815 TaxID=3232140 RepID=UPI0034596379